MPTNDRSNEIVSLIEDTLEEVLYSEAVAISRRGEYERAENLLKDILKRRDDFTKARILLGKIYAQRGKYDEAIEEWQKVLENDSEDREVKAAIEKAKEMRNKAKDFPVQRLKLKAAIFFLLAGLGVSVLYNVWLGLREKPPKDPLPKVYQLEKMEVGQLNIKTPLELATPLPKIYQLDKMEVGQLNVKTPFQLTTPSKKPEKNDLISKTTNLIKEDKWFHPFEFRIKQTESTICLSGEIPTFYVHNLLISLVKSVPGVKAVDATDVRVTGTYVVKKGETLFTIAYRLYGDSLRWKDLFQRNKDKLKDPNKIFSEMKISVPLF